MRELLPGMEKELHQLQMLIRKKEIDLEGAPDGRLRISGRGENAQYYRVQDGTGKNGIYLRRRKPEDRKLIATLAQKDYDERILKLLKRQFQRMDRARCDLSELEAEREQVYEALSDQRKELVNPDWIPEKTYIEKWLAKPYQTNPYPIDEKQMLCTDQGMFIRSKSELIIAEKLEQLDIPYRYEPALILGDRTIYPDFLILNVRFRKEIYWEHLGMMDDPVYNEDALRKIKLYEKHGLFPGESLILTHETRRQPLDVALVNTLIRKYCM